MSVLFRHATFYLVEMFRHDPFYLVELFRHATVYLAEQFRHTTFYLAELFRQIASPFIIWWIIDLKQYNIAKSFTLAT